MVVPLLPQSSETFLLGTRPAARDEDAAAPRDRSPACSPGAEAVEHDFGVVGEEHVGERGITLGQRGDDERTVGQALGAGRCDGGAERTLERREGDVGHEAMVRTNRQTGQTDKPRSGQSVLVGVAGAGEQENRRGRPPLFSD